MVLYNPSIIFFLVLFPLVSYSQNNVEYDSLLNVYQNLPNDTTKVNVLHRLHELVIYKDINLAKKYADEELALANKINFTRGIASSFYNFGGYFENIDVRDTALIYYEKSKQIFDKLGELRRSTNVNKAIAINELAAGKADRALERVNETIEYWISTKDSVALAKDYNFKAGIYEHKGEIELALQYVFKAIKIHEQLENHIGKADALLVLAALESTNDNSEKALEYELEALSIYNAQGDKLYAALTNNNLGQTYRQLDDLDNAKLHLNNAIQLATEIKAINIVADAKTKLGNILVSLGNYEPAINVLKEALETNTENQQVLSQMDNLNGLANAYNKFGKPSISISYTKRSIEMGKKINTLDRLRHAYYIRSTSYQELKNYEKALEDYKQSNILKDSLFQKEKIVQIERLKTEFEVERKEKALIIEENKVKILEKEAALSRLQKLLLALGLGLSFIIAGFGYYGFRQKIKREQLVKEKLDLELDFKKKKLTTLALQLAKKNELLKNLKKDANELLASNEANRGYQKLINSIDFDLNDENNWKNFSRSFEEVHKDFNSIALKKYPTLTPNELRLMSLLKMNLSSKEIANILNISIPGIKKARQRLRKKMGLETRDSLESAVLSM